MDEIGGYLNAYTAREATCFYARTLSEHMPKALDILCDMVRNPRLDEEDIELEKGIIKEEIAMYEDDPKDLCTDTFYEKVWKDNPVGTENTVAVHIRHLREKIEVVPSDPRYIKVVWGRGYTVKL